MENRKHMPYRKALVVVWIWGAVGILTTLISIAKIISYNRQETRRYHELRQTKGTEADTLQGEQTYLLRERQEKEAEPILPETQGEEMAETIDYDWDALAEANSDIKGWLYLPDTPIDFPVVGASDNSYYLGHDFWKQERNTGCPFMDKDTGQWDFNRTVYAHSMGELSGAMFSPLLNYKDRDYFEGHSLLYYTGCYSETSEYRIMAVVKYDVKDTAEWDFRTRNHESPESRALWMGQLKERALYYAEPDGMPDSIFTLATCDRSEIGKDGRLVIVAAKCGFGKK